jgi:hypothetical protein
MVTKCGVIAFGVLSYLSVACAKVPSIAPTSLSCLITVRLFFSSIFYLLRPFGFNHQDAFFFSSTFNITRETLLVRSRPLEQAVILTLYLGVPIVLMFQSVTSLPIAM